MVQKVQVRLEEEMELSQARFKVDYSKPVMVLIKVASTIKARSNFTTFPCPSQI